jgi:hypothetical protein
MRALNWIKFGSVSLDVDREKQAKMTGKRPVTLGNTNAVLRRFDSETRWIAVGLVSFAIIAAVAVAVDEQSDHAVNHVTEEKLSGDDRLLNANPSALPHVRSVNSEIASSEVPSGQTFSTGPPDTAISPQQNPFPQTLSQEAIQTPVPTPTPGIYQPDVQSNSNPVSSAHGQDIARVIRTKSHNSRYRPFMRLRSVDVKARLIALWHESLARNQATRGSTTFWNSIKGKSQKLVTLVKAKRTRPSISGGGLDAANQK